MAQDTELDLAPIKARAEDFDRTGITGNDRRLLDEDVPALLATIERLRAQGPH